MSEPEPWCSCCGHPVRLHVAGRCMVEGGCEDRCGPSSSREGAETPGARKDDGIGLSIDMLDADRLAKWADNFAMLGPNVTEWGSLTFIVSELRRLSAAVADTVRDVGTLRAALPVLPLEGGQETNDDDLTRVGMTARTGPPPYRTDRQESQS